MLLCCAFSATAADEASIRKTIEAKLGGAKVEGISTTPLPGIYEVRFRSSDGVQIIYTNADATHIIIGRIVDAKTDRDLTEERMRKLATINMDTLPYDLAVKVQRGNGKRTLVIFSDPHCPACKQFEKVLATVDDITIHYFMYPVIRPELADHSKSVWCSPDRAKAWLDVALRNKPPAAKPSCANPVEKNVELGRSLGVNSTPTLVLSNGERVTGGLALTDLNEVLDSVKR